MSKYIKIYNDLIMRAQIRIIDGYTEKHHIIPKCLGGSNNKENIVRLTAREHFIAHQLLVKIYPTNHKLIYACHAMCNLDVTLERVNNRMYAWLKHNYSIAMKERMTGENNVMFGKKHSEEAKSKVSEKNKGKIRSKEFKRNLSENWSGENHPMFGKKHSEESKQKMSKNKKGQGLGVPKSEEQKKKISEKARNYVSLQDKFGNFLRVDKTDPRYLNKELFGVSAKTFKCVDYDNNIYFVPRTHPEVLSGELIEIL